MIADDLFAGAGGWDLAAAKLGIHARGVENMKEARATRDAAGLTTIHDDVWTFAPDGNAEGLIASPPCQTFSLAGKGKGREALDTVLELIDWGWNSIADLRKVGGLLGDERTALVLTPLHYAYEIRPEWIAWEQVPTVLPVWERCATELFNMGYSVWTGNLQAEMYGVPQTRKRAFLLASRTKEVGMPTPTHSKYYPRTPEKLDEGVKKWISMAEALGWGHGGRRSPTVTGGGTETGGAEPIAHLSRYTSAEEWSYRSTTMKNSANRSLSCPAPTIAFGHDAASAQWMYRGSNQAHAAKRPLSSPAPTVNFAERSNKVEWMEPTLADDPKASGVRVTVQEAGILQSFPADYQWQGAKGKQYLQVGNAVPPLLAEAVLSEVAC